MRFWFSFYFGGLKLITDSELCLHVQNEMRVWADYFNNEGMKIHFSFHYLKISGICKFWLFFFCLFSLNWIIWKIGLKPSFHFASVETISNFVSERRWHVLECFYGTTGSCWNNCRLRDLSIVMIEYLCVLGGGWCILYFISIFKKPGEPRINFEMPSFYSSHLLIHSFCPSHGLQGPPGT